MHLNRPIELATAVSFHIGPLFVLPTRRSVSSPDAGHETVEPRVMLVLVALVQADGATVSRDELVDQCWNGRIVGDDSINRVISRLRRLSERHANCFAIETISKVGYRLEARAWSIDNAPEPSSSVPRFRSTGLRSRLTMSQKRLLIGACFAAVILGVANLIWQKRTVFPSHQRPVINVDPFTIAGPAIPPELALQVRAETADLLANERFYAVSLTPQGVGAKPDWRIAGTIASVDNGRRVVVFAQLLRSGSNVAVAELRIERDAQQPLLARSFGLRIGRTSGCVLLTVTNPDLTGGFVEAGLPALVDACMTWHDKATSTQARIERVQAASVAFPRSAYFPARLGEMFGDQAADGVGSPQALRALGARYVSEAEAIDPTQPHIFLAKAQSRLVLKFSYQSDKLFKTACNELL